MPPVDDRRRVTARRRTTKTLANLSMSTRPSSLRVLGLAILALFAALIVYIWPTSSEPLESARRDENRGPRGEPQAVAPRTDGARVAVEPSGDSATDHPGTAGPLFGVVQLKGLDGYDQPVSKGYFLVQPTGSPNADGIRINLKAGGEWIAPAELRPGEFDIPHIVVASNGRDLYPDLPSSPQALMAGQMNRIAVSLAEGVTLEAVARDSGRDLEDLTVAIIRSGIGDYVDSYGEPPSALLEPSSLDRGSSPLVFPRMSGIRTGWVRAPGYAWGRFAFGSTSTYVRVELAQGADLRVELLGEPDGALGDYAMLVVRAAGGGPDRLLDGIRLAARPIGRSRVFTISGLPLTKIEVGVVRDPNVGRNGPYLAWAEADLTDPADRELALDLSASDWTQGLCTLDVSVATHLLSKGRNANEILIVEQTEKSVYEMRGRPAAELAIRRFLEDGLQVANIPIRGLAPGSYRATIVPTGLTAEVELEPGRHHEVAFEDDTRRSIELSVLRADGAPARRAQIHVRPTGTVSGNAWREVGMASDQGVIRFSFPAASIQVIAYGAGPPFMASFELVDSDGRLTMRAPAISDASAVVSILKDGEPAFLPLAFWSGIRATAEDGGAGVLTEVRPQGAQVGKLVPLNGRAAQLRFSEPGRYVVVFPPLPEGRVLPKHTIEVSESAPARYSLDW